MALTTAEMAALRYTRLLALAAPAMVNEAAQPLAALADVAILGTADRNGTAARLDLAAYGAVTTSCTFAANLCNFLVSVTMAQVSSAVGQHRWEDVGSKARLALALAVLIGLACTGLLLALRQPIFRLMSLEHEVRRRAHTLFAIRASATPFVFVGRACLGLLGGYQRVMLVAGLSAASAALDIAGNYIALHVLHWGLDGTGWATALAQAALAVASLVCAVALPPAEARGRVRWCSRNPNPHPAPPNPAVVAVTTEPSLSVINETAPLLSTAQPPRPRPLSAVRDYLRASGHIVVRAVLLQTATYSLAVVAARLGTAVLAAHQIVAQLWMVTSYINDGFADVGTMVGGRFWGAGRLEPLRQLARRLLLLGLSVGLVALTVLLAARHPLQRLFTHDVVTLQVVDGVWLLLALMQPVNAAVFVYDGLLYAMQAFAFKRNIVALATLGLYLPAIAWAALYFHNLLAVWVAYALLTACRCAGAGWKHRSLEAAHRAQRS